MKNAVEGRSGNKAKSLSRNPISWELQRRSGCANSLFSVRLDLVGELQMPRPEEKRMRRFWATRSALFVLAILFCSPASATVYTLTNGNSTVSIDDSSQSGAYNWVIDGTDVLFQQWFWYRIGGTGPEHSIDSLTLQSAAQAGRFLDLTYSGSGFTIDITYLLTGGTAGSRTSDIAETIQITNTGATSFDFHFFQYSDFDLTPSDSVVIDADRLHVTQRPAAGGLMMSETVALPQPSYAEANTWPVTLGTLNDADPTTLNNVLVAGPGDVTWAFQWDKTIAGGGSFIISKDKKIDPVPEPATLLMVGGALLFFSRLALRKVRT